MVEWFVFRLKNHIRFFSLRAVRFFSPELTEFLMLLMLIAKKNHRRKRTLNHQLWVTIWLFVLYKALRVWSSHSNWVSSLAPYYNLNPRVWNLSSKKTHQKQSWQTWNLTPLDGGSRDVLFTVTCLDFDIWSFRGKYFWGDRKVDNILHVKGCCMSMRVSHEFWTYDHMMHMSSRYLYMNKNCLIYWVT